MMPDVARKVGRPSKGKKPVASTRISDETYNALYDLSRALRLSLSATIAEAIRFRIEAERRVTR